MTKKKDKKAEFIQFMKDHANGKKMDVNVVELDDVSPPALLRMAIEIAYKLHPEPYDAFETILEMAVEVALEYDCVIETQTQEHNLH